MILRGTHPIVREIGPGTTRLTAVLPFEIRPAPAEGEPPVLSVQAKLISKTNGVETPLAIVVGDHKKSPGKPEILIAQISLPAVEAGLYDLEISFVDAETDQRTSVRKAVQIVR